MDLAGSPGHVAAAHHRGLRPRRRAPLPGRDRRRAAARCALPRRRQRGSLDARGGARVGSAAAGRRAGRPRASGGRGAARGIRAAWPSIGIVALAVREADEDVVSWAEAGVSGLVSREAIARRAARRSRGRGETRWSVAGGRAALLRRVAAMSRSARARRPARSRRREREIVGLIGDGLSNKEIARTLQIELATVKNHVHNILEKLSVGSRTEAVAVARARGELDPDLDPRRRDPDPAESKSDPAIHSRRARRGAQTRAQWPEGESVGAHKDRAHRHGTAATRHRPGGDRSRARSRARRRARGTSTSATVVELDDRTSSSSARTRPRADVRSPSPPAAACARSRCRPTARRACSSSSGRTASPLGEISSETLVRTIRAVPDLGRGRRDRRNQRTEDGLMPPTLTFPGVYIEEVPSGVRPITGVATSITAFIGRALRGPVDEAITITSYGDFERIFGGAVDREQPRLRGPGLLPQRRLDGDHRPRPQDEGERHGVDDARQRHARGRPAGGVAGRVGLEAHRDDRRRRQRPDRHDALQPHRHRRRHGEDRGLPQRVVRTGSARRVDLVLAAQSTLVRVRRHAADGSRRARSPSTATAANGNDGDPIDQSVYHDRGELPRQQEGPLRARERRPLQPDRHPAVHGDGDVDAQVLADTISYVEERRAVLIMDPPAAWTTLDNAVTGASAARSRAARTRRCTSRASTSPTRSRDGQIAHVRAVRRDRRR